MRRVVWSDQAREDLIEIRDYLAGASSAAAPKMAAALVDLAESLCEFSERGRQVRWGVRELTHLRPYVIRYAVLDEEVRIVTIRHSARKPLD